MQSTVPERSHKVFYFIPSLVQGGSERQILELVTRIPKPFSPVFCLHRDAIHYRSLLPPGQPKYILDSANAPFSLGSYHRLLAAIRVEKPTIFHSYLNPANFWGRLVAHRAGVPIVISSVRARMMEPQFLLVERLLARRAGAVVVNSVGIERELRSRALVPPGRIHVVHNFLDLDHFRPPTSQERHRARQRWGLDPSKRILLMPGRVSVQKHQIGLLLALDRLAQHHALPSDVLLLLAGRGRGAAYDRLTALLCQLPRLRAHVRLLGNQVDVRSLYWAADLLCLPSLWEGLPNAALEGSACGLPALLSHAANLDRIVQVGKNGWEAPTGDHRALAAILRDEVLPTPVARLRNLGAHGRARMLERFAPDRVLSEMLSLYGDLLRDAGIAPWG
ncbi:MAG: glycosyltransferase [Deltaproteobacteria bacterium]|nr:glycosyltransferase [Deltaproteobacteria bacterium]